MKIIKSKEDITQEYIEKLASYIKDNQATFFLPENMAKSWCDFEDWPDSKTDRNHLVMPEEVMLIDRDYRGIHTFCICGISKSRKLKFEIPVIKVDELEMENWRNGYFLLPDLS